MPVRSLSARIRTVFFGAVTGALGYFAVEGYWSSLFPGTVLTRLAESGTLERVEPVPVPPPSGRHWTLAMDGWHIAVEGRAVAVPRLAALAQSSEALGREEADLPFGQWIVPHALAEGMDWRLVAAVIEAESNFDPEAVSEKGAVGLMQVRPAAAADVGETSFHNPEDNIRTGVKYLRLLSERLADVHPGERLAFVLAAYHMGLEHVRDAQALAEFLGFSPRLWHGHVERVLHLLEEPAVYTRLPAGYAQGRLTAAYVERVLRRYHELSARGALQKGRVPSESSGPVDSNS